MKSFRQLFLIGLTFMFILASCTIEKRVYMSGYNIEWKKRVKDNSPHTVSNPKENKVTLPVQQFIEQPENKLTEVDNTAATLDKPLIRVSHSNLLSNKLNTLTAKQATASFSKSNKVKKLLNKSASGNEPSKGLLYVLCVLIPWLAVGLATDWDVEKVIYNLLWSLLCLIPGIIHAFIIVSRSK